MANTNIPTSLSTSTQIPVDGKTYKKTLSEITTVTNEQAFTYYSGMCVTVAENNKQYTWKPVDITLVPVSNIFTYPDNHIVEGVVYSNVSFAFYENSTSNSTPPTNIIYSAEGANEEHPNIGTNHTIANIYNRVTSDSVADTSKTDTLWFRPLASNTINISIKSPTGSSDNMENPIWLEYNPNNVGFVGPGLQYDTITEAIGGGHSIVHIIPIDGDHIFTVDTPLSDDITLVTSGDIVLRNTIPNSPIFTGSSGFQKLEILNNANIELQSPIIDIQGDNSTLVIDGTGLIRAYNINNTLISTNANNSKVTIKGVNVSIENTSLADIGGSSILELNDVSVNSINTLKPAISVTGGMVNVSNTNMVLDHTGIASLMDVGNYSNVSISNTHFDGSIEGVMRIADSNVSNAASVIINNSDISKLTTNTVFTGMVGSPNVYAENLKLNNILLKNASVLDNDLSGIKQTNIVADGESVSNITEAPVDGMIYGRSNSGWVQVIPGGDVSKSYVDSADSLLSNRILQLENEFPLDLSQYETISDNNLKLATKANSSAVASLEGRVLNLENGSTVLAEYPTRAAANLVLPAGSLFINTKDDAEEKSTWFLDVTIYN